MRPDVRLRRALVAVAMSIVVAACGRSASPSLELAGETMGTSYAVTVAPGAAAPDPAGTLAGDVALVLARIESLTSTWNPDSALSRFNDTATTEWVPVPEELALVVDAALAIRATTDGAFDVTAAPLVELWGFGPGGQKAVPSPDAIASARELVGEDVVEVRIAPPALRKSAPDVRLDLSGIAKGYAVDAVAALLTAQGHPAFLVEIGGEVRARGERPGGGPWRVGVEVPDGSGTVGVALGIVDRAVATSGDYRNFFVIDGERYTHMLDPRTGRPLDDEVAAVTVIAGNAALADGLATGLAVLGPEAGLALAARTGVEARFVLRRGEGWETQATPGFAAYEIP